MLEVITSAECADCKGAGKVSPKGRFTRLFRLIRLSCAHCDGLGYRTVTHIVPEKPRTDPIFETPLERVAPPRHYNVHPPGPTHH